MTQKSVSAPDLYSHRAVHSRNRPRRPAGGKKSPGRFGKPFRCALSYQQRPVM